MSSEGAGGVEVIKVHLRVKTNGDTYLTKPPINVFLMDPRILYSSPFPCAEVKNISIGRVVKIRTINS